MNKIKDFFYDTNDILVALIILCLAALVIFTRVNALMAYPEMVAAQTGDTGGGHVRVMEPEGTDTDTDPGEPGDDDAAASGGAITSEGGISGGAITSEGAVTTGGGVTDDEHHTFSLYITYGQSTNDIAKNLIKLGYFETVEEFTAALDERGASTKIQSGQFIIPADATTDELIEIITKPGL